MTTFQKFDLAIFVSGVGGFFGVFLQVRTFLLIFKNKISQDSELISKVDFLESRVDRLEDFISRNSSFK